MPFLHHRAARMDVGTRAPAPERSRSPMVEPTMPGDLIR